MTDQAVPGSVPGGAGIGGVLGGLLGDGSIGRQLLVWGVLNTMLGQALQPVMTQVMDEVWPRLPSMPLSPADAADLVLKGWWDFDTAKQEAKATGVNEERFRQLVNAAGEPIAIEQAMEALRRQILEWDKGAEGGPSAMEAIRQSRVRPEWADTLRALQWVPLPPSDAVDAVVEGQIDYATGEQQAGWSGVKPEDFRILVNTRGNPPSPTELIELYKRGLIGLEGVGPDQTTVQQGIYEGATKDKWWRHLVELADYVPPPRTVTALEREGVITPQQAQELYAKSGLSPELAAIYAASASSQKLAKHKDLAESTVLDLYYAHVIDAAQCDAMLAELGYNADEAGWLRALKDLQRSLAALNSAVTRIGNLYTARKLTDADALGYLRKLGLPEAQIAQLLTVWGLDREATVRVLTPAEIATAFHYKVFDQATAIRYLVQDGYTPYDAWVMLSAREHGPLPDPPAEGANVQGRAQ